MPVEVIAHRAEFNALMENWVSVYRIDTEAQWFLSSQWMSQLYDRRAEPIRILCYRHNDSDKEFAAFFPLRSQAYLCKSSVEFHTVYRLPGNYWGDYTGMLCDPELEGAAISAFGQYIAAQSWRKFYLENLWISDRRLELLLQHFSKKDFSIRRTKFREGTDGPDLSCAPRIELPSTFDSYLADRLSANARQRMRRFRRKLVSDPTVNIRLCTEETMDDDLSRFRELWRERWATEKGDQVDYLAKRYSFIMRQGLISGDMTIAVMTDADIVVGMVACYTDKIKQTMLFYVTARDESYRALPTGLLLHAYMIEIAIDANMKWYDLLRGDEPYKYSLGANDETVKTVIVTSNRSHKRIDREQPFFLDDAVRKLQKYQRKGESENVQKLFKDLLDIWPENTTLKWLQVDALAYNVEKESQECGNVTTSIDDRLNQHR